MKAEAAAKAAKELKEKLAKMTHKKVNHVDTHKVVDYYGGHEAEKKAK